MTDLQAPTRAPPPAPISAKPVGAVVQTVKLLRVLAESERPLGVSAAARASGLNTSTAFNILRTLAAEGLAVFDEGAKTYALGAGLFAIAKGLLGPRYVDVIRPEMFRLASETGCLIALWEVVGERVVLVDRALANRPVRLDMAVTQRMPLMLGAIGRAAAAALDLDEAELRSRFAGLRWEGRIDEARYVAEIRAAARDGYGVDRETLYRGIVAIAAVITDERGAPAYGLSAIELANQIDDARIAEVGRRLGQTAALLSFGGRRTPAAQRPSA